MSAREELQGILGAGEIATLPKKVEPHHYAGVVIRVGGVEHEIEVEVHGTTYQRVTPTRSDPGQPGGFVVEELKYEGTYLTHLFSERQLELLAEEE